MTTVFGDGADIKDLGAECDEMSDLVSVAFQVLQYNIMLRK